MPSVLTMDEALRLFRERGFDLLIAEAQAAAAEGDVTSAGAVSNPQLFGSVGHSFNYDPGACSGCSANSWSVGLTDPAALSDVLTGKRGLRVEVARAAAAAARLSRDDALRTLSLQVRQALLDAALEQGQRDLARELAESTERTRSLNERRLQAGAISEAELARAEVAALQALQAVDLAEQALRLGRLQIAFLLGSREPAADFALDPGLLDRAMPGEEPALDVLAREALEKRPDLLAASAQEGRAEAGLGLVRRQRVPDIALSAQYQQQGWGQNALQPPTLTFGVQLPLPIFYRQQGEIARAQAEVRSQSVAREKLRAQALFALEEASAPHPRSRPGAVREGRRVAPGAPRRAAGLGADARRVPQGPARFLAGGLPARRRRGAHVKRSLLLLALIACSRREDREAPRPPAGEVWLSRQQLEAQQMRMEVIAEQEVTTTLDTPARIAFDDLRVAHVFAPVSGRIVSIAATPGQQVRKGDPLVEIESADVGAALSDLGKAEADFTAADRELKRLRELVEAHAAAQRELDQAQSVYDRASAELARARRRAGLFRGRGSGGVTQRFFVRSPIDGEVIARTASPGTDVQGQLSGGNAPELFTIGSIDPVWVYADVYEADLARVKLGAPVQVKVIAYPDTSFAGRIEWISSTLDPVTRTARLRCTLRNAGRELLPEMYATVSVATPPRKALVVPRSAVLHVGE